MRKRLLGLFASTMIVFAACGGSASPSPAASASGSAAASSSAGASASASGSAAPATPDLFGTKYKDNRKPGQTGGQIIFADWQEATEFNPYYQGQVTEANVARGDPGRARHGHERLQVRTRPGDGDPDARQRRRQGPRRRRRRDDRDLEAPPRPEMVGRPAPDLR